LDSNPYRAGRLSFLLLLLLWLVWGAAATHAQTPAPPWPPLDGVVVDDTGQLDHAKVNAAAADLQALGVKPLAVYLHDNLGFSDTGDLAEAAALHYGYGSGNTLHPGIFILVLVQDSGDTFLLYGEGLDAFDQTDDKGRTLAHRIRVDYLVTLASEGKVTEAFAESFEKAASEIRQYNSDSSPPTPSSSDGGAPDLFNFVLNTMLFFGVAAALYGFIWPRIRNGRAKVAHHRDLIARFNSERDATNEMISDLEFPADPEDSIQYKFLRMELEHNHPELLAEITSKYHEAYKCLSNALDTYSGIAEQHPTTDEQMDDLVDRFKDVQQAAKEASDFLQQLTVMGNYPPAEISSMVSALHVSEPHKKPRRPRSI
jgi:hypothetical protein